MMIASSANFSVKFSQQRYACVLDPTLALSRYGLLLVKQLGTVMDIWLGREFWNIINNTRFYLDHPELLLLPMATCSSPLNGQPYILQDMLEALQQWEQMDKQTTLTDLKLFRIGERPEESFLPREMGTEIIWYYESLAHSLEAQASKGFDSSEVLTSAFRDTVALAAAIGSPFILTHQFPTATAETLPPGICMALTSWQIPCQAVTLQDEMATLERNYLRQIFVQAGLAKFLWAGLHLTVLHLLAPSASQPASLPVHHQEYQSPNNKDFAKFPHAETNLWKGSQGFWYQL
ncbi:hypothetical protein [Nostoc sp. GT001]|uniref:hypothetical protein n=1 Tax=Nostoc sp. GT001 TaxID=3056647 RepID=UPI0025AA97C0|nr:hypothetical protein [Nostoc sp. GT001]MDM9580120.1 hypothetical protein [Nostoc sp. GT001]